MPAIIEELVALLRTLFAIVASYPFMRNNNLISLNNFLLKRVCNHSRCCQLTDFARDGSLRYPVASCF